MYNSANLINSSLLRGLITPLHPLRISLSVSFSFLTVNSICSRRFALSSFSALFCFVRINHYLLLKDSPHFPIHYSLTFLTFPSLSIPFLHNLCYSFLNSSPQPAFLSHSLFSLFFRSSVISSCLLLSSSSAFFPLLYFPTLIPLHPSCLPSSLVPW